MNVSFFREHLLPPYHTLACQVCSFVKLTSFCPHPTLWLVKEKSVRDKKLNHEEYAYNWILCRGGDQQHSLDGTPLRRVTVARHVPPPHLHGVHGAAGLYPMCLVARVTMGISRREYRFVPTSVSLHCFIIILTIMIFIIKILVALISM